jgi:NAD(P)-dependent dehydrogenase (short-subunit alcohol dehydrogenase family)
MTKIIEDLFGIKDQVAVVTGGSGVLGRIMALGLAQAGARVAIIGRRAEACNAVAKEIQEIGGTAIGVPADVTDRGILENAAVRINAELGPVDILVNGAGGNQPEATAGPELPWYAIGDAAIDIGLRSNFISALYSCQVFGRDMVKHEQGSIINISSMSALRTLSRVMVYSAAKAALTNFTQWLAMTIAQESSPNIRVNAIAPGFFVTEQNRHMLTDPETGEWKARGAKVIEHTPMGRIGVPEDLVGTLLWLASPASKFVTGIVVPVDGGFATYSGV